MPDKIPTIVEQILKKLHLYKTNEIDGNVSPHLNYAINTLFEFLPKEKEAVLQVLEAHKEAIKEKVRVMDNCSNWNCQGQSIDKESIDTASKNFIDKHLK